jgi:N-succinyldiaminopimelate aminotransferase
MTSTRVSSFGTTIFTEITRLAQEHNAINLGQGFPDFDGPAEIRAMAFRAMNEGRNQYALSAGETSLRRAIASHAARFYQQTVNPDTEITVTCGATEAITATMLGLVDPDDEMIVFEPYYDSYVPALIFAGGIPRFVPLRAPNWEFDPDELAAAFSEKTRFILVNTPHNPTGHVFSRAELELIASLCQKWNVTAITDEVYEHILFDGREHVRLATLPGLAERTVTISSQGKTFSFTGWKIGWTIAPPELTVGIRRAHQFITFAAATPFQHAAASALALDDEYYRALAADYQKRRDFLSKALQKAGFGLSPCGGTYFLMADIRPLGFDDDVEFVRWLVKEKGVAAIPPSAFYSLASKHLGKGWARFAFCKKDETLQQAAERLLK